jgi:cell division protein FtsI/penicillin-binding protein 2
MLAAAVLIAARLAQIQIIYAGEFETLSQQITRPTIRFISAPRGRILDRNGAVLVSDEPTSDICVHYKILIGDERYLEGLARRMRREPRFAGMSSAEVLEQLRSDVRGMWLRLAELSGQSVDSFVQTVREQFERVEGVRAAVRSRRPTVQQIEEENQFVPVLDDVDRKLALSARIELESLPWLRVVPGSHRVGRDLDALVHVVGRTALASQERIQSDELADDDLRRLRVGDRCGISGVERLAETRLRGTPGQVVEDFDRREMSRIDPLRGRDAILAIDADLQRETVEILREAVAQCGDPSGASAVVLDADTREVLVLASYPTYPFAEFNERYAELRDDVKSLPLMFRAVAAQYPPGSTCKAMTLVAGLCENEVTASTRFHCTGYLLAENPTAFRCWIYNEHPGVTHDLITPNGQDAESAIKNSCNIYFFHVGERVGPERLCEWFRRFGLGRTQGTGLIEEVRGVAPDLAYLQRTQGRFFQPSDAWNFAIGQGEVTITPLQSANVAATVAAGRWRPVRLATDDAGVSIGPALAGEPSFDEAALRVLRSGMWRVVNERGGTAVGARLDDEKWELLGKTGSAQTPPRAIAFRFTCEWADGRHEDYVAASRAELLRELKNDPPIKLESRVQETYPSIPAGGKLPAHAWFIGFAQPKSTPRGEAPRGRSFAICVMIEFGRSGGKVAGPPAKKIMTAVLKKYGAEKLGRSAE